MLAVSFRRCVIIAEFWRPEVARIGTFSRNFCVFWKKTTFCEKISKILFGKFRLRHRSTLLCVKFVKIVRREIGEIMRYLSCPKNLAPSQTVTTAGIAPKVCHGQPPTFVSQISKFHPNRFTFGGVIAGRVKAVKTRLKVFPILGEAIASRRVNISTRSMYYRHHKNSICQIQSVG